MADNVLSMDGVSGIGETCPKFFCFVQGNGRDYLMASDDSTRSKGASSEERKLELRLGPPGGEEEFWSIKEHEKKNRGEHETLISSSYFSPLASVQNINNNMISGQKITTESAPKATASSGSQKR